jgi:hypothetical protein
MTVDAGVTGGPVLQKPFTRAELAAAVLDRLGRGVAERRLLARIRTRRLRDLYMGWVGRHQGGCLPATADIQLDAFGLRHNGFLVEAGPQGLRYHSAGDIIVQRVGQNLAGEPVAAVPDAIEILGSLESAYRRCTHDRMPIYQFIRFDLGDGEPMRFERLLLPLSDDRRSITHLLGVALFEFNDS